MRNIKEFEKKISKIPPRVKANMAYLVKHQDNPKVVLFFSKKKNKYFITGFKGGFRKKAATTIITDLGLITCPAFLALEGSGTIHKDDTMWIWPHNKSVYRDFDWVRNHDPLHLYWHEAQKQQFKEVVRLLIEHHNGDTEAASEDIGKLMAFFWRLKIREAQRILRRWDALHIKRMILYGRPFERVD